MMWQISNKQTKIETMALKRKIHTFVRDDKCQQLVNVCLVSNPVFSRDMWRVKGKNPRLYLQTLKLYRWVSYFLFLLTSYKCL